MDDEKKPEKSRPVLFEHGALDKTRKNLGAVEKNEALKIAKRLGGEIGIEKPVSEPEEKASPIIRSQLNTSKKNKNALKFKNTTTQEKKSNISTNILQPIKKSQLPKWDHKELHILYKMMSSKEYNIQQKPNFLRRLFKFSKHSDENIKPSFITITLHNYIDHIQLFTLTMHNLLEFASPLMKSYIKEQNTWQNKTLHFILHWDIRNTKIEYLFIRDKLAFVTIEEMIPLIKKIYRPLITLFFIGNTNMTKLIKEVYSETFKHNPKQKKVLLKYAKQATSEWVYISEHIVQGMYPLLLRMASKEFHDYPKYLTTNISDILYFLKLTKFDLILPQRLKKIEQEKKTEQEKEKNDKKAKLKLQQETQIKIAVQKSLSILENLFPSAGWERLDKTPDMYPYFQPLFHFEDGINLIPPSNPLQITLILIRILEDFFQACRYIDFTFENDLDFVIENDSFQNILNSWALYREYILEKQMIPDLKEFVNQIHTKPDYATTAFGKRSVSSWLWQEKFYFLPHLAFDLSFIEKPKLDTTIIQLSNRVAYLKKIFSLIINRTDDAISSYKDPYKGNKNLGASNLLDPYEFEIGNTVSHRLEILLGGKNSPHLTNLNLLKYTLCVINVLDWWINSKTSFAYLKKMNTIHRTDEEGHPIYSVPLLTNQNKLFVQHVKNSIKHKSVDIKSDANNTNN